MNDLILPPDSPNAIVMSDRARVYASASKSAATLRAYSSAWTAFTRWCRARVVPSLPATPATVASFIADLAAIKKVATIERHLAAVSEAHRLGGHVSPTVTVEVHAVLSGIRRTHGTAQRGKAPLLVRHLRELMGELPEGVSGIRNRALLLIGFAGALRRSELVGLNLADVNFVDDGLILTIRQSKTDQEKRGRLVGVPFGVRPVTCPVRGLRKWLEMAAVVQGPVFRPINRHHQVSPHRLSAAAVGVIVQEAVASIGLDSGKYGGHSLRSGLLTECARAGVSEVAMMRQSGHASLTMLRKYIRPTTLFQDNAASAVGL